jgi:hypothetical protein
MKSTTPRRGEQIGTGGLGSNFDDENTAKTP